MKKGFTLIELLAVIVILAVIAIIAVPTIRNVVEKSKREAALESARNYIDTININNTMYEINKSKYSFFADGMYENLDAFENLNIKGELPLSGEVEIEKGKVKSAYLCVSGYNVDYSNYNAEIRGKCSEVRDRTIPVIAIDSEEITTKQAVLNLIITDEETGIKEKKCYYSRDKKYDKVGNIVDGNKCVITGLIDNTNYNYKITAKNGQNMTNMVEGTFKTVEFSSITIVSSNNDWDTSKTYTIEGSAVGSKLQYQVGNEVNEEAWIDYEKEIVLTENANIYARLFDGENSSVTKTFSEGKIDNIKPTLTVSSTSKTTNSITINFTRTYTGQAPIKTTSCKTTSPSVINGNISGDTCTITGLSDNTTYNYEVYIETSSGTSDKKTGSIKTDIACDDGISSVNGYKNFAYTGSVQTFNACAGRRYKLEVWGAQGGEGYENYKGGKGGYSVGEYYFSSTTEIYVVVGGQGGGFSRNEAAQGGYNGGGSSGTNASGGGGATHISTRTGLLSGLSSYKSNILIVAGGGGGMSWGYQANQNGGYGGGLSGETSQSVRQGASGTQNNNSGSGIFGSGGSTSNKYYAGGGGGLWGGAVSTNTQGGVGGGGSGYLSSSLTNANTYDGNTSFTAPGGSSETGHSGNGYARITYIGN